MRIRLQRAPKQISDQRDHLRIISAVECLIQRHIILIDQQNRLFSVVLRQKLRQRAQAVYQYRFWHGIDGALFCIVIQLNQLKILFTFCFSQILTASQKLKP